MSRLYCRLKFIWLVVVSAAAFPIVVLFPRNPRKMIFGAWFGRQFADNPKYFLRFLIERHAPYKYIWIGDESIREEVERLPEVVFVRKGSLLAMWHVLTAKWAMWNVGFSYDISDIPTFGRIRQLSFWHGPQFKGLVYSHVSSSDSGGNVVLRPVCDMLLRFVTWARTQEAFASFSSQRMVENMKYEAPLSFRPERSRAFGSARIDYLIQNRNNEMEIRRVRNKYAEILGLPIDKKWYLYMPTWRKGLSLKFSFLKSEQKKKFQEILEEQNAIIIEKQHPQVISELRIEASHERNIYTVSQSEASHSIDTQELLLACHRLITDYSSCCVDFMALNRPEIYFMYDYDFYMNERGMAYEVEDVVAGPIAKDEGSLMYFLSKPDNELLDMKGPNWRDLIEGETGHACEQFAKWIGLITEETNK